MKFSALRVVCFLLSLSLCGCFFEKSASILSVSGPTMGTTYRVTLVAPPRTLDEKTVTAFVSAELERINDLMSSYDPDSQLSRFNAQKTTDWFAIDADTLSLIDVARHISKETLGAYDVTMGSVSALWGFGPDGNRETSAALPKLDEILVLLNNIGYQLLLLEPEQGAIRKLSPDLMVDLSSIGKGFAVDKVGELLEARGVSRYLVEIGGEIRTRGLAADGERWKVGIEWPEVAQQKVPVGVSLENSHIATSGDYRNYREVDGQRYSHILDGRTGFPISHSLAAVTVLHGSTALADAWATAFMVIGYDEALAIATKKGLAAHFTLKQGDGFVIHSTPAFKAYSYGGE